MPLKQMQSQAEILVLNEEKALEKEAKLQAIEYNSIISKMKIEEKQALHSLNLTIFGGTFDFLHSGHKV